MKKEEVIETTFSHGKFWMGHDSTNPNLYQLGTNTGNLIGQFNISEIPDLICLMQEVLDDNKNEE